MSSARSGEATPPSYEATGFFVLRTPLLPFSALEAWGAGLAAPGCRSDDPAALADALAADDALLAQRLREHVLRPEVREALFCASPSLDEALDAWLRDPESPRARGVAVILVRYFTRMIARATPFGLFSGSTVGSLGSRTRLELGPAGAYTRHSRLDMDYLSHLVDALGQDRGLRDALTYRPSSGLYRLAKQIRGAEARVDAGTGARSYHLVALDGGDALDVALARARSGARLQEIAEALVEGDPEASIEEARSFVDELVDNQVLVSDLVPPLTGAEPAAPVLETLRSAAPAGRVAETLRSACARLRTLDERGLGGEVAAYRAIASSLAELPAPVELSRLFQVDLHKPAPQAVLGGEPLAELFRGLDLMARIFPRADADSLSSFRDAFKRRFEEREVALVEALDEDRGVGFSAGSRDPSPLLHGLAFPPRGNAWDTGGGPRERWLAKRLVEWRDRGGGELRLDDRDIEALSAGPPARFPDSCSLYAMFAARSPEALEAGDFRVRLGIWGPNGAVMLARFCHGDPELSRHVQAHLRAEEALRPHAILAEIVHLPEGRTGNVLSRPVLRGYEIPYLGRSGAPIDRQIPIEDLFVSVEGDRVILRSKSLSREILPRLTSAHVYGDSSLSMYRFLGALQTQRTQMGFAWHWGALAGAAHLPRVTHGRQVLALAEWTLGKEELRGLEGARAAQRFQAVRALRERLGLPRWVTTGDDDQLLVVDLDNVLSIESFLGLVKKKHSAVLREMFPAPDELCAEGPEGRFVHEVLVPVVARREPTPAARPRVQASGRRSFVPGSDWLFVKLYAGKADVDALVTDVVPPLLREAIAAGHADRWFFLRYDDPDWHLRLRVHGEPAALLSRVLPELTRAVAPLLDEGTVHRMALDTYDREIERYGGERGVELAEELFCIDSDAAVRALAAYAGDARADARWQLALLGMHRLLGDLGLELPARIEAVGGLRASFGREHNVGVGFERQLGARYRAQRAGLEALLAAPEHGGDHPLSEGIAALAERSERLRPVALELRAAQAAGALGRDIGELCTSYLHMHANRMLCSEQRSQELILYDWLLRLYESQAARQRKST